MKNNGLYEKAERIASFLREKYEIEKPLLGLVLGSGLGDFAQSLEQSLSIPYESIPDFPRSTVEGHAGNLVFARWDGKPIVMMQGRVHYYESHEMSVTTLPIRVLKRLGVRGLFLTNSAGSLRPDFLPGQLMLIRDHLNLMGTNPLLGPNDTRFGPRFPDMSTAYDPEWSEQVLRAAQKLKINLKQGVYCALSGPSYETPAEVRMLRGLGGDVVGMSTAPEVIVARHMGLRCVGISFISNLGSGLSNVPLSHDEVKEAADKIKPVFKALIQQSLTLILRSMESEDMER